MSTLGRRATEDQVSPPRIYEANRGAEFKTRPLGAGLALAFLLSAPAAALVYIMPTDESMVDRSAVIVFGNVLSAGPGPYGSAPATDYLFAVEEVLKGFVPGSAIMVRQPGGVGADGVAMAWGPTALP